MLTVEGLSPREKDVYSWTFANAGAVQCGFCIPGMVMSAKGLLDANPDPAPAEVKKAINGNICRCTGYAKIEQAVLRAGQMFREDQPLPDATGGAYRIGDRMPRLDARAKVLGSGEYVNDMKVPGMLYGAVLRAPRPRVLVRRIDTAAAKAMPGVAVVLTARDVPGERLQGHIIHDWPAMIAEGEETRYVGDALALVAAGTKAQARAAAAAIQLDWEELAPLSDAGQALAEGAPRLHPKGNLLASTVLSRGDADAAIAQAVHVVHHVFQVPPNRARLPGAGERPGGAPGGRLPHGLHGHPEHLRRPQGHRRGAGGGARAGEGGQQAGGRRVRGQGGPDRPAPRGPAGLGRQAAGAGHPVPAGEPQGAPQAPRHGDGLHRGLRRGRPSHRREGHPHWPTPGAYASLGGPVLQRACTHAGGPYKIPNVSILGLGGLHQQPARPAPSAASASPSPASAWRCCLNDLAARVGISPWEMRWRNAVEAGDALPNGQIADPDTALKETLLAVKDVFESRPDAGSPAA